MLAAALVLLPMAFEFRFEGVRIGTRSSALATAQAEMVAASLMLAAPGTSTTLVPVLTQGDTDLGRDLPLAKAGVDFTGSIDAAVLEGVVDVGVHSLKDVPPEHRWTPGLTFACHLPRASPLDVIVGATSLAALPSGARVGTASVRRQAQLRALRPDLTVVNVRGDVHARLSQLDSSDVDALVLAKAGLERLGVHSRVVSTLPPSVLLPGACQGIVCAVCREGADALRLLRLADDHDAHVCAAAERAFLNAVDRAAPGSGRPPLGALMARDEDGSGSWALHGLVARPDGTQVLRVERTASAECSVADAAALGRDAAEEILDRAGEEFFAEGSCDGVRAAKETSELVSG
jgi:hydroxymethylbilane synthase